VVALPELADGAGNQGIIEVFKECKAEHLAESDGDVVVRYQVEEYLERVKDRAEPGDAR